MREANDFLVFGSHFYVFGKELRQIYTVTIECQGFFLFRVYFFSQDRRKTADTFIGTQLFFSYRYF